MLGVHCSVAGGLEKAYDEARTLEINAMQVFTRNQRQWKAKPVSDEEQKAFADAGKNSTVKISFSHCSYLINLASEIEDNRMKSVAALQEEVDRCTRLGLSYCVLHPGAAGSQNFAIAIDHIAAGLKAVLSATKDSKVMILLENTAGQGSSVGGTFENLLEIRKLVPGNRIGYCFDTCHAFAAGYDMRTEKSAGDIFNKFNDVLGIENLKVFHLNDSKGDLGTHLDRHDHIGKGKLGLEPFRFIMNQFKDIPKVLETPKENDGDRVNLTLLRSLVK